MADKKDDHLTFYREFFENFAETVNPNDQLPVKLGSYKLINSEVVGGVIDWTTQYLTQKPGARKINMDWAVWRPRDDVLASIKELLQDALVPDSEVQKDVQSKLKNFEIVEDFTYYLLYIVGHSSFSEEIRSLSGILLKNNIKTVYSKLPHDSIMKIRQLCLMLLGDPCRDVRSSISYVIFVLAKDGFNSWPELFPFLLKSFENPDESSETCILTLFSICEELVSRDKSSLDVCSITKEVLPKFVALLTCEGFAKKEKVIKLINQFLQDYYKIMKESIDMALYLRSIMALADSEEAEVQKHVCHTFVMYVEYREESLLPHLHDVIVYILMKTQHEDLEVALGACEFWLAITKLSNCKEILTPYIDKLIPILLKNMKYSPFELIALKDSVRVDQNSDTKDVFPFRMHENKNFNCGDNEYFPEDENGEYLANCDDVDDFYVGWTLRKCSAASLDAIAVKFGDDILLLLVPFLNEILYHQEFLVKESAILALGAISEGCMNGLKPHLPGLIDFLITTMGDEHSMVRVITCWTLSRYVGWIVHNDASHQVYFMPVMTILLKHFVDDNKRVQRAAISAFCVFQEEAQVKLIPYIELILEGFQLGFQKFHYRSLYLLYDAINVLAHSVGSELNKSEYIEKLMPPIMQKLNEYSNYSDDQFIAVLECLANIIPSLGAGFLPYSEVVYSQCMEIIIETFMAESNFQENLNDADPPDKEPMHVALDVLYSMALGLKSYFYKYVTNSNLVCVLYSTMQDCSCLIRQTSIALYGELVLMCYPYLSSNISDYFKLLIKNLDESFDGVCKNASWVIGKLCTVMGVEIHPYVPEIVTAFLRILRNPMVSRAMYQTVAVSLCTLCCACPDITISEPDVVLQNCCMSIRTLKDSDEKDLAYRGLCHIIVRHPEFCQNNFMYFCDAVGSWTSLKPDLKDMIRNIILSFKEQCGDVNWQQFYVQCPEMLKIQLYNLKCPPNLIAYLIQIVIDETRKACKKQPLNCGFIPTDNAYQPLKLMQTVMAKTNEVCLRYLDNSMLCSLPPPGPSASIVSVSAAKNRRRRMEDRHAIIHDLNTIFNIQEATPSSYYAIFDGHAGHDAAAYSSAHLHQFLAENKHFVDNPQQALIDAFLKTDTLFDNKCKVEGLMSGTTAVCALLRPKEECLYIAWVGDSQALLVNQGRVLQCVEPHKPSREDERERIEKLGGFVIFYGAWRVNGQLAVSRAIGDSDHKPYVTAEPDVKKIPLDGGEDFLILACDGLWDHLSEDDAARAVYSMVSQCPDQTDQISERLVQLSKERGSADNISVIVVFLRDPSVIANWANCNSVTMDASLDNANNPFATNGSSTDNAIIGQKTSDGLLLNLSDGFGDQNGGTKSPPNDFFHHMNNADNMMFVKSNNTKRPASDFDDDDDEDEDLGPETNIDTLDDAMMPSSPSSKFLDGLVAGTNLDMAFNPFMDKNDVEKATLEIDFDLQKQQSDEFEDRRSAREETPTPPVDAVHYAGGLDDHVVAESGEDSEDEWNYIKGEEANKENISPSQPDLEVAEINEEAEDNMSQLNPNAAEFVPVSPTGEPSPACRALLNDPVIAQSPKRATDVNINLPNDESEFEREAKSRPSDVDLFSNGHADEEKPTSQEIAPIDEILNGRNIDDIPEFQPCATTPTKVPSSSTDEFHFGPNATPFTPSANKTLDPLEAAALSTMAVYGDESTATLGTSFEESNVSQVNSSTTSITKKEQDPMSMSFYQDDSNDPFDLNKVQVLPDNIDDFLNTEQNGEASQPAVEHIDQTTDLDKVEENEKELASPVSQEEELVCGLSQTSKCPDLVQFESQLDQANLTTQKVDSPLASPLPLSPEPTETTSSPQPDLLLVDQRIATPEEPAVQAVSPSPTGDANSASTAALHSPTTEDVCNLPVEDFCSQQLQEQQIPEPASDVKISEVCQLDDLATQFSSPPVEQHFSSPTIEQFSSLPILDLGSPVEQSKITTETAIVERLPLDNSELQSVSPVQSPELVSSPADQAMDLDHPLMKCVYPLPAQFTQESLVTEKIVPEFPELETVATPSDATESREDEVPHVPAVVETCKVVETPNESAAPVAEVAAGLTAVAAVVAGAADVAVETVSEKKTPITKKGVVAKKSTPTAAQKSVAGKPASLAAAKAKPAQASPRAALKAASTTSTAAVKSPLAAKPAPKPRSVSTATVPPKTTERKPLTNGTSISKASATTASARMSLSSAPKTTSRPTTAPAKTTTTARTASSTLTSTARPKPTSTLTSRTALSSTTTRTVTSSSTTAGGTTTRTTTLSKTPTAAAPAKPRPTTAPAKPRTLLNATKTFPKTASIEKQNKEKANKLTASTGASGRTVTGSTLTSTTNKSTGITKKPETKTLGSRTAITKTTSAVKSTTITKSAATTRTATTTTTAGKKPIEITRNVKTKTTKIEKPVANGISTVVSEQITVINAVNDLVKDNSPVDNKLIVETNAAD